MSDINQEILTEIRKLRRSNQWASAAAILILVILAGYVVWLRPGKGAWSDVSSAMRQSDYPRALARARSVAAQHPNDYYGHWYLGKIYLAMGDVSQAETEYSRAYDLNPLEDLRRELDAVRKRREHEQPQGTPASVPPA